MNEVAHSIFYAPMYVAIEENYFAEEGLDVELVTGYGADKVGLELHGKFPLSARECGGGGAEIDGLVDVDFPSFSAKKSYIEKNPEVIQAFTNALQKGMEYCSSQLRNRFFREVCRHKFFVGKPGFQLPCVH